jgi:hypothetical protein
VAQLAIGQRQAAQGHVQRHAAAGTIARTHAIAQARTIAQARAGGAGALGRQLHLDRRGQLLEQPRPRAVSRHGLLGQHLLLGLAQQVLAVAAHVMQMVAREIQSLALHQLLRALLGQRGPLQIKKKELRLDRRSLLLHALQQRTAGWIGRVGGEAQCGIRARAAHQVVDRGQLVHRLRQARPLELRHLARVALGEGLRARQRVLELAPHARLALAVHQRPQVPGGLLQLGVGRLGRCFSGHRPAA